MDKKAFGSRLRQARKDRGLTSEKLSELCNINATYLRQIEGGPSGLCQPLRGIESTPGLSADGLTSEYRAGSKRRVGGPSADGNTVSDEDHYRHVEQCAQGASGELG